MGSFYTSGKNEYYWRLLAYVQDKYVYTNDRRVVPYTPGLLQDYVDFFPEKYSVFPPTVLSVFINGTLVASGLLNVPSGLFYTQIQVPKGDFVLQVRDALGNVLRNELFSSKNYAMFFEVAGQSYEERRVLIEQVIQDLDYQTIRSDRVYQVVGVFFGFTPPAGWSNLEYRETVLGNGGTKPGFVKSFFFGGTLEGFVNTIKSITGDLVVVAPVQDGDRWVIFDAASAPSPTDATSPDAWFLSNADDIPLPNHRCLVMDEAYVASALVVKISGAYRTVVDESVFKETDSFLESSVAEPFTLATKTLTFAIDDQSYTTTFGALTTTAALAAADILAQNPTLTSAVYASAGRLRLGTAPVAGQVKTIKITAGSALPYLGYTVGQNIHVAPDILANPNQSSAVTLSFGTSVYTQGVEFTIDPATGQIIWVPSTALVTNIPAQGSVYQAAYSYIMKREIETMAEKAKDPSLTVEYQYLP